MRAHTCACDEEVAPIASESTAVTILRDDAPAQVRAPETGSDPIAQLTLEEVSAAIQALPHGGTDDATREFRLPPQIRASVSPILTALRWGAVMFGLVFAAPLASEGDLNVVTTLSVVLFMTSWRTFRPNRLASNQPLHQVLVFTDAIIIGVAVGWSGGLESPYIFCVVVVALVGAFGWGMARGLSVSAVAIVSVIAGLAWASETGLTNETGRFTSQSSLTAVVFMFVAVTIAAFARNRLLDAETRRVQLAGKVDALSETNDLLHLLNEVARTLPVSLDLREAIDSTRVQLTKAFSPDTLSLLIYDDQNDEWTPHISDGCVVHPATGSDHLPVPLRATLVDKRPLLDPRLTPGEGINPRSQSGMYALLRSRNHTVGAIAIEHTEAMRYTERDLRILSGLSDVLALTVDNARWFGRLRTLGADEERRRIARDLHDRLGQWLTYISFELERIIDDGDGTSPELDRLHNDVGQAIDELRETLRQLRSGVTEDDSLADVAADMIRRLQDRSELTITLTVPHPEQRLAVPVENELLRILQEALANVEKHAHATSVEVRWDVDTAGRGVLTVTDDGSGFDVASGVRETAYGLVGMRERADVIGARLKIESDFIVGTTVTVTAGATDERTLASGAESGTINQGAPT
ncbi:MAG: histidine kinase [Acidimicrobiales bacterium]